MAAPFGEEWFNQPFDVGVIFGPELRPVDRFRPVPVLYPVSSRVNVRIVRQRIVSTRSRPSFTVAFRRFPEADPRLLTRAVLGLHNSVWHWYRPGGTMPLDQVSDFYVPRCLAVLGLPPELAETANGT